MNIKVNDVCIIPKNGFGNMCNPYWRIWKQTPGFVPVNNLWIIHTFKQNTKLTSVYLSCASGLNPWPAIAFCWLVTQGWNMSSSRDILFRTFGTRSRPTRFWNALPGQAIKRGKRENKVRLPICLRHDFQQITYSLYTLRRFLSFISVNTVTNNPFVDRSAKRHSKTKINNALLKFYCK
jgi:hypothetical protein